MNMSKFERRKRDLERKFEEEMKALQEAEQKEIEKKIDPLVSKIGKVAEEEARRALEANPEILEFFSFKKREAGKEMKDALEKLFNAEKLEESTEGVKDQGAPQPDSKPGQEDVPHEKDAQPATEPKDPFSDDFKGDESAEGEAPKASDEQQSGEPSEERKGFMSFGRGN